MDFPCQNRFSISTERQGPVGIQKASFPLRYGKYSEIKTPGYEFIFNLNGEIKFIRGLNGDWHHPAEQLKRTDGNDWVYYSVGDISGDEGLVSWLGEYYLPCLPYPSNSVWEVNYRSDSAIMKAFAAWSQLYADLYMSGGNGQHARAKRLIQLIIEKDEPVLHSRMEQLHGIIGGRISVLPPDTRHVDYEVIPITIAEGCLYHCGFCCVKSARDFRKRSKTDIIRQILDLKRFYGRNLENYHAVFLGNHDALHAGKELICFTAAHAGKALGFCDPGTTTPFLYIFGSVTSLLKSESEVFEAINRLPFYTYINVGFESVDPSTLERIQKPVNAPQVRAAFQKMLAINADYAHIEVTGNFLMGEQLPPEHDEALIKLLQETVPPPFGKGAIYVSPLQNNPNKRELLPRFFRIKKESPLPVYTYLIQRL